MDRLVNTFHKLDDNPEERIAHNEYNELGELITKDLHEGEQFLDYSYNIRGWLTAINDPASTDDTHLFGMKLHYNDNPLDSRKNFNGNISAMEWSNYDANGSGYSERAYSYAYDGLNRLTDARHYQDKSSGSNAFDVQVPGYDLNGNIKRLIRKGENGSNVDNLTYTYNGNQLLKVTDSNGSEGFDNGSSGYGTDYTYDANGNMTADANKGITSIEYNHLNLPTKVVMSPSGGGSGEDDRIEYLYDAAGIKLQQKVYEGGSLKKTTDYVGEFIYETIEDGDRELALIQHDEGRLIYDDWGHDWDYQYHLKDHLGNVRMTFSTLSSDPLVCKETFETGEDNGFQDLHRHQNSNANTTPGGNEVERLQSLQTGAMVLLAVNKDDEVDMSVQANYESGPSDNTHVITTASALFTAVNNAYGSGAEGSALINPDQSELDQALAGMGGKNDASTAPRAFINYIFFDKEMGYVSAGFTQISTAAQGVGVHEEVVMPEFVADREGYILAYLSNENQEAVNVHFDDFTVYHGKTNVVSTQDYYPFGLTFNESVRTASKEQRFKFNDGVERIEDLNLGLDLALFRTYNPSIARWLQVDPISKHHESGYAWVTNNPILWNDPLGLDTVKYDPSGGSNPDDVYVLNDVVVQGENQSNEVTEEVNNSPNYQYASSMQPYPGAGSFPRQSGAVEPFFFVPNPVEIGISVADNLSRGEFITAGIAAIALAPGGKGGRLLWGFWDDYAKIAYKGRTYAKVGDRLYTRHAIDRLSPSGLGVAGGAGGASGRSISPTFVEDVITNGARRNVVVNGVQRTVHTSGSVTVITEEASKIVVTVITK